MKLGEHYNSLETNTNFQGSDFGIGNVSVVIDILRNRLYKYKIRTLTQEYLSNARDANREVKSDHPINITLPTVLDPTIKIRDFGPGISPDRINQIFILYGNSTKRGNNEQTGGFGLGSKSAFSYTDSFVITTVCGGKKYTYVAHLGTNSQGRLDLMGVVDSQDPNGTEIQIAVKPTDIKEFENAVYRTIYFWKDEEMPIILNAQKAIKRLELEQIGRISVLSESLPSFINWTNDSQGDSIAVIDGIPYPLKGISDKFTAINDLESLAQKAIVIHFNTGEIEVSATRESISDTEFSVKRLQSVCLDILNDLNTRIDKEFNTANSLHEFVSVYKRLSYKYRLGERVFKDTIKVTGNWEGVLLNLPSDLKKSLHLTSFQKYSYQKKRDIVWKMDMPTIYYDRLSECVWSWRDKDLTKKHIMKHLDSHQGGKNVYVIKPKQDKLKEFKKLIDLLEIPSYKTLPIDTAVLSVSTKSTKREVGYFYPGELYKRSSTDLKSDFTYYFVVKKSQADNTEDLQKYNEWMGSNEQVILINKTEVQHFADMPNVVPLESFINNFKLNEEQFLQFKKGLFNELSPRVRGLILIINKKSPQILKDFKKEYQSISDEKKYISSKYLENLPLALQKLAKNDINRYETYLISVKKYVQRKYPLAYALGTNATTIHHAKDSLV